MNVLGVNAFHADVSAVLIRGGELVVAVEEERLSRVKHVGGFPEQAILACLDVAGLAAGGGIDHLAISRRPRAHAVRRAWYAITHRPRRGLVQERTRNYQAVRAIPDLAAEVLAKRGVRRPAAVHWVEHHPAHLASAFFVSPFDHAVVASVDGFGDMVSTAWALGRDRKLDVRRRTFFPHSLGILYLAITQWLGFNRFGEEYKVMGLAPYGRPDALDQLRQLVRPDATGWGFELDLSYFQHWDGGAAMSWDGEPRIGRVFSPKLEALLGPAREPEQPLGAWHQAVAHSLQTVFEDSFFAYLNGVHASLPSNERTERLCLAGGCVMNSVANGKILERTPFRHVFIQPAASDNGTALGAAYHVWHQTLNQPRNFVLRHASWGTAMTSEEIDAAVAARRADVDRLGCEVRRCDDDEPDAVVTWTADALSRGLVVGWCQGRFEWGARALGYRSILADPRRADMREILNARVKMRESFRPFAPSILEDAVDAYFEGAGPDPFMMGVHPVRLSKRSVIPAVTHVDGSGRVHTVSRDANPRFWALLQAFRERTGVPVLLNTSFNENEPIVARASEALDCFLRTEMDALVMGSTIINRPSAASRL